MYLKIIVPILLTMLSFSCLADFLTGKVIQTEGHLQPSCRTLALEYNDAGVLKRKSFRIKKDGDDINAVALAALMGDKRVRIAYLPGETTGCGTDDMIRYITIYKD